MDKIALKRDYNLADIEEIGITLAAFEAKFLYQALGLAIYTNEIGTLMSLVETLTHYDREDEDTISKLLIDTGKKNLKIIKEDIKYYKRSSGSIRNEIRFNFQSVQRVCKKNGYTDITVPLLAMIMIIRTL